MRAPSASQIACRSLYNWLGRFDGVTTKPTKDGIGVRFACTPRKRQRIVEQLTLYVAEGLGTGLTYLRHHDSSTLEVSGRSPSAIEEIAITPEMLSAGEAAARCCGDSRPLAVDVLKAIYCAMARIDRHGMHSNTLSKSCDDDPERLRFGT
jgi:hypothetical protein